MNKWISVKENGFPDKNGKYLCTLVNLYNVAYIDVCYFTNDFDTINKYEFGEFGETKGKAGFYIGDSEYGYVGLDNVLAWMPIPEPYKESEEK